LAGVAVGVVVEGAVAVAVGAAAWLATEGAGVASKGVA